jgi:hypothetical protein
MGETPKPQAGTPEPAGKPLGGALVVALRALAARWARLPIGHTPEDDIRSVVALALAALVQLLLAWWTPQGERLRRAALALADAALPEETPPPAAIAEDPAVEAQRRREAREANIARLVDAARRDPDLRRTLLEGTDRPRWSVLLIIERKPCEIFAGGKEYGPDTHPIAIPFSPDPATMARNIADRLNHDAELAEQLRALDAKPEARPAGVEDVEHHLGGAADYLAGARGELDDLWWTANDLASDAPTMERDPAMVHREGYAVLQELRAAEREMADARRALWTIKLGATKPPPASTTPAAPVLTLADLADLRAQLADVSAVALDATARPSRRRLGRRSARETAAAAHKKALAILDLAEGKGGARAA